ncbi:hypothetical protein IMCC21224_113862 [Puniceibacterium sp. IMCC21224]|nr:hypothetical protein IMCC21224_113862 [Puniceibacterium sp. IMCC21224]
MSSRPSRRQPTYSITFWRREGSRLQKKIPTITRADPTYSAALRQGGRDIPERGEVESGPVTPKPATVAEPEIRTIDTQIETAEVPNTVNSESTGRSPAPKPSALPRTKSPTRKIGIRVNALERQEAALQACGVEPARRWLSKPPPSAHLPRVSDCGILLRDGQIIRPIPWVFCLRDSQLARRRFWHDDDKHEIVTSVWIGGARVT